MLRVLTAASFVGRLGICAAQLKTQPCFSQLCEADADEAPHSGTNRDPELVKLMSRGYLTSTLR